MFRGKYFPISSFTGGYCGNLPPTALKNDQAYDLDNIVIKIDGLGFRSRPGTSKHNATALNSGAAVQGIGYLRTSAGVESLGVVAGAKFYGDPSLSGTFTDRTGSLTIGAGQDKLWDIFPFKDVLLGFGGSITAPDAPFSWDGTTSNAAAIGGSAPSAYGAFAANNRVFAFRTAASPSSIYWSTIGDQTDFSGAGSGSAVAGSLSDNQSITAAAILSTNYVLIFKENSTYQMVISSAPFPIYTLFDTEGCAGKNAVVNVNGTVYWINSRGDMLSTDGESLKKYPQNANDLWSLVTKTRLPYVCGFVISGTDFQWLVWCVTTTGTTNNMAIVWDLENECWLRCTTGFKFNVAKQTNNSTVYTGNYAGFVCKPLVEGVYADASESSPGTITSYWRSGWINPSNADEIVQVNRFIAQYKTKASGNVNGTYGFDFVPDHTSFTLAQAPTSSEAYTSRMTKLAGRGNFFQFKLGGSSSTVDTEVTSILLGGKVYGQKRIGST